jgi:hypothetical protein
MVRKASISSVTTMLPISAENADHERPLTAIAASNGPISLVNPMLTRSTTRFIAPNRRDSEASCIAKMNSAHTAMTVDHEERMRNARSPGSEGHLKSTPVSTSAPHPLD